MVGLDVRLNIPPGTRQHKVVDLVCPGSGSGLGPKHGIEITRVVPKFRSCNKYKINKYSGTRSPSDVQARLTPQFTPLELPRFCTPKSPRLSSDSTVFVVCFQLEPIGSMYGKIYLPTFG